MYDPREDSGGCPECVLVYVSYGGELTEARTDNTLYFGCRSAAKDFYYSDEWEKDAQDGKLVFRAAFSRDQVRKAALNGQTANEKDIGQEGVRPRLDRRRFGEGMGTRRSRRRLGLHLGVQPAFSWCF